MFDLFRKKITFNHEAENIFQKECKESIDIERIKFIHPNATIGPYSYVRLFSVIFSGVTIGKYTSIAYNCTIGAPNHDMNALSMCLPQFGILDEERATAIKTSKKTIVGNDVWIGANSVVIEGLNIGDGAVIAAGAVVTKDIPAYSIVAGIPARIVRYRFSKDIVERLLKLEWWNFPEEKLKNVHFHDIKMAVTELEYIKANGIDK